MNKLENYLTISAHTLKASEVDYLASKNFMIRKINQYGLDQIDCRFCNIIVTSIKLLLK